MLVCWEWLSQYVDLDVLPDDLALRFAMSGLNHESTEVVGRDTVIDLEVTSNRSDCLGHVGVAREASVLLGKPLEIPEAVPPESTQPAADCIEVVNQFPQGCSQFTARVIRGIKVGPSPEWLTRRLSAIGIASVNNVVDVTNYVMMECGQPLHAFDFAKLHGGKIIVRPAANKEKIEAIDHRTYELDPQMVVIADAERAIGIGGVMGGAGSEVSATTVDVLIEAAAFEPLLIRRAARLLKLQSAASFRFERRPDPTAIDWASRRCCDLILQVAGGQLCRGFVRFGAEPPPREPIRFRMSQILRVLGIEVPTEQASRILAALGCQVQPLVPEQAELDVVPPTWRADLTREIDLIEEVARIFGYENIPENVQVPLNIAAVRPKDIALGRVRSVMSAWGVDEALTASVVSESFEKLGSVWSDLPALETEMPLLVGSRLLRRSLLPSLLAARHTNQAQSIRNAQLYEVANIYLPSDGLPVEICCLAAVLQGDLQLAKGIVEELVAQVAGYDTKLTWHLIERSQYASGSLQEVRLGDCSVGFVGLVSHTAQAAMSLDQTVAAIEINVDALADNLQEVRRASPISAYPSVTRDLNFIVDEPLRWAQLEQTCLAAASELLRDVRYQETYRDIKRDGEGKKRLLLSLHFQSLERTLTSDEIDTEVSKIIAACEQNLGAKLLG